MKKLATWTLLVGMVCLLGAATCYAEVVTGIALIANGNVDKAREDARRDALRAYVEAKVGVHLNASSETVNFVLTKDRILAESEGYVLVKRVLGERQEGDILKLTLDLEAGSKPLELGLEDTQTYLRNLSTFSSRYGLDVALTDVSGSLYWSNYMAGKLAQAGFVACGNDAITKYLGTHPYENDLVLNAEARRIGRLDRQGNAVVRGRIGLTRKAELVQRGVFRAVAEVTANVVAYDSNAMDAATAYAAGLGVTPEQAERLAKEQSIAEVVQQLAQQSVLTTQVQTRGGRQNIITQIRFLGCVEHAADLAAVKQAVVNADCQVRYCAYEGETLLVALRTSSYLDLNDAVEGVLRALKEAYPLAYPEIANAVGSTQYVVHLRG